MFVGDEGDAGGEGERGIGNEQPGAIGVVEREGTIARDGLGASGGERGREPINRKVISEGDNDVV